MNKSDVSQRVLKDGKPLDESLFQWDEKTNTFSSDACGLVVDFGAWSDCTFTTGSGCTFTTLSGCTFKTGSDCTFTTEYGCTWNIDDYEYPYPPMRFVGSRYWIGFARPGVIRSGCIEKPAVWWQENVRRCAEENGYTPEQQDEYAAYVDLLVAWAERFGWLEERILAADNR